MLQPGFEWDPRKRRSNLAKHGVDFLGAARIFDGPVLQKRDNRRDYGEARIIAFGAVEGAVLAVVFTWRGANRRLISARAASREERDQYAARLGRAPT